MPNKLGDRIDAATLAGLSRLQRWAALPLSEREALCALAREQHLPLWQVMDLFYPPPADGTQL